MGSIVLLDDSTINKIAAGEVIERPASVVKELVENAIDAGAKNITVEVKNGGISYIRVTDDGKGFMPDDMEIAFERHATSKIRKAEDLEVVKSMGFRGEALASIAAISKVTLVSKTAEQDIGYKIQVTGGKISDKQEEGCPTGSSITVEDLFYNTPVRYKFLKRDFTESGYIEDVIDRIALMHPEIAIKYVNTGKVSIQTTGSGKLKEVVYSIYGREIADNVMEVNYPYEDITVSGVIGKPAISRSNRSNQLFYVNSRFVKDKTLSGAAEQGFKGMVTIGKHGFLILNLNMDPKKVDVNVHPAKLEVRFEDENKVFKAVYHAIKETLLKTDLVADTEKDYTDVTPNDILKTVSNNQDVDKLFENRPKVIESENKVSDATVKIDVEDLKKEVEKAKDIEEPETNEAIEKLLQMQKQVEELKNSVNVDKKADEIEREVEEENSSEEKTEGDKQQLEDTQMSQQDKEKQDEATFEQMYERLFGRKIEEAQKLKQQEEEYSLKEAKPLEGKAISMFEQNGLSKVPTYQFVGIAFKTYIILTMQDELYILDQHAAHERIMYEKVKQNYYNDIQKDSQLMLLPDVINLTTREMGIYKDNKNLFEKAGFISEEFGDNTVKLTGVPTFCMELDTKELFLETLDEINTVARTAKQEIEEKFIATVACKAAVKAHMALTKEEVDSLMTQLLKLPNPFTCPHGRPTVIKMTKNDIEKKFARR